MGRAPFNAPVYFPFTLWVQLDRARGRYCFGPQFGPPGMNEASSTSHVKTVLFLASDDSSFITGTEIVVEHQFQG